MEVNEMKIGEVRIADEVVGIIARLAAAEIDGISGMSGSFASGIVEIMGKKSHSKGVKVQVDDKNVTLDVHVNVKYGTSIPEVANKVQANIKQSIETMTGLTVDQVNVHIVGVSFPETETTKQNACED